MRSPTERFLPLLFATRADEFSGRSNFSVPGFIFRRWRKNASTGGLFRLEIAPIRSHQRDRQIEKKTVSASDATRGSADNKEKYARWKITGQNTNIASITSNNIVSSILLSLLTLLSFWSPLLSYIVRWLIMPYCVIYILPFICWFSSTFHRDVNHFTLLVCFHQNNSI